MKTQLFSLCLIALFGSTGALLAADFETAVDIAPNALLLGKVQSGWVTVHVEIPFGDVLEGSVTLNGVPVDHAFADDRGEYVGKFPEEDVKAIVSPPSALLTLEGTTVDGETFAGSREVMVKEYPRS